MTDVIVLSINHYKNVVVNQQHVTESHLQGHEVNSILEYTGANSDGTIKQLSLHPCFPEVDLISRQSPVIREQRVEHTNEIPKSFSLCSIFLLTWMKFERVHSNKLLIQRLRNIPYMPPHNKQHIIRGSK